jgi:hypothetical protein
MAKKSKPRQTPRRQQGKSLQVTKSWRRRHQKMLLGAAILLLVVGVGVFVRYRQHSTVAPRLRGAVENHYTRGSAGAPVVVKEFSDYT